MVIFPDVENVERREKIRNFLVNKTLSLRLFPQMSRTSNIEKRFVTSWYENKTLTLRLFSGANTAEPRPTPNLCTYPPTSECPPPSWRRKSAEMSGSRRRGVLISEHKTSNGKWGHGWLPMTSSVTIEVGDRHGTGCNPFKRACGSAEHVCHL